MTALPAATSKVSVVPPPVDNVKDWVKPILSVPIVTEVVLTVIFCAAVMAAVKFAVASIALGIAAGVQLVAVFHRVPAAEFQV